MTGKVALVTGGNRGIGYGMAEALAEAGADIIGVSASLEAKGSEVGAAVQALGRSFTGYSCDFSDRAAVKAFAAEVLAMHPQIDILINNAGIQHVAGIDEFPVEKWDAIIAINLSSAFHTTAAALPLMRAAGWGRAINIASAHGLTASPYKSAYVSAKHGIVGMTKTVALETAEQPITANAVCPGYVLTPLVEAQIPDTMKEYNMTRDEVIRNVMLQRQPSKEFATVEQMGGTCVFLCSDAAAQITGTTINVDGGWTAL